MSNALGDGDRVLNYAGAICDTVATDSDLASMDAILIADPQSRVDYLDYCWLHVALKSQLRASAAVRKAHQQIKIESGAATFHGITPAIGSSLPLSVSYLPSNAPIAYLLAMAIVGIGLAIMAVVPVSQATKVASQSPSAIERHQPLVPKEEIVGRITGMVDCKWDDRETNPHRNSLVSIGQKYTLASGLLEITYDTGAKVILQGPVTYEVESFAGGYLSIGKLTARLEKDKKKLPSPDSRRMARLDKDHKKLPSPACGRGAGGEGGLNQSDALHSAAPLFAVRTPTAVVTDLGTEFGVEVDMRGGTTSHVFRGEIQVQIPAGNARPLTTVRLKAPESLAIDHSGVVLPRQVVDSRRFVRSVARSPFEGDVDLSQATVLFEEPFSTDSSAPTVDYPALRFSPIEIVQGKSASARFSVQGGILRMCRDSVAPIAPGFAAETDRVTTVKKFSGRLVVSVDIGADSENCGNSHVALQLGDVSFLFHAGHCANHGIRGLFYIAKSGQVVGTGTDLGFIPDVDVLHHMFVYYDGKSTFQLCLIDGLNPKHVFRTSYTDSGRSNEPFAVGVYRSGFPNVGMFDNLRVVQLPAIANDPAAENAK